MIFACDMDGVIAALHKEWFRRYNDDYSDHMTLDRVKSWGLHQYVKPECGKKIYEYLRQPGLYGHIEPMPDALWGVQQLRAAGHEVVFVSSCQKNMVEEKIDWLTKWGFCRPGVNDHQPPDFMAVATESKAKYVRADILIDDSGEAIREWIMQTRRRAILYDYPHNQDIDMPSLHWQWCARAIDWRGIVDIASRI